MNRQDRARLVQKILDQTFPHPTIPLKHTNPYTLLIATLLSAQCTDKRVNQVTPHLFTHGQTPEAIVKLSLQEVIQIIRPCGLYNTKAKAILGLSQKLIDRHKGKVPRTFKELESLPGIGHKTASVVLSHAFGKLTFPVDTHIHRCAKRWGLSKGTTVIQTERDLKSLYPQGSWGKLHLQIIHFARTYCPARSHKTTKCPICSKLFL